MKRRSLLKAIILAPFAGLIKLKERKKLNMQIKIGEAITVPKGQKWEIHKMTVVSPTMGEIDTTTSSDLTYTISGYIIE